MSLLRNGLRAVQGRPTRRTCRTLGLLLLVLTTLLLYRWLCCSPQQDAAAHAAAFARHFGWLRTRSLLHYVEPLHNVSVLEPPCRRPPPRLALVVTSAPGNWAARRAVRRTWGQRRDGVSTVFLLGLPGDPQLQDAVRAEAAEHADILQEPFVDHYRNLTVKTVFMLKWLATRCAGADFVLKVDDDMFVDIDGLLAFLATCERDGTCAPDRPVIAGYLYRGAEAYRSTESKYYLPPALYAEDVLPDYVSGTAYVVSRAAVWPLYSRALETPYINLEDVFISGLVAPRAGVRLLSVPGFFKSHPLWVHRCTCQGCITLHALRPDQIERLYKELSVVECGSQWTVVNWFMPWVM